ncbi:hypothetical protein J5N97_001766 [Dioscorea zingiberensis]|uniref:Pentatricopeptide repeat-containing protein n=1 Tax=Dioscorea zingiberensis TaxID=325984 RepID=A0A9D5BT52_9LILI|nr:hypothetical protein J5N97_001766 [Dioscorea zingiberensis]
MVSPSCEYKHAIFRLLKQCKTLKHLQSIHGQTTIHGLTSSSAITNLLFTFTSLLPNPSLPPPSIHYALSLFHSIPSPSTFAFNLLLRSLTLLSSPLHSLLLFLRMRRLSISPDSHTFPFALTACARLAALPLGRALHLQALKFGFVTDVFVVNTLITMYSSSNSMPDARRLFDESPRPDVVTYNSMIHGHAGMTSTAHKLFDEMESVYGVRHELKHYGCMADLLGRAGLIKEAMEMIGGMGMVGDKYVWGGVLGGCRIHGDVEVGEMAARRLWELKPEDSGVYSAMASMYANKRRWGDVAKMRALMSHENVTKNAAFSSIQVDDIDKIPSY